MRSVAERLIGRVAAGAPEIGFSSFDFDGVWGFLGDFGSGHAIRPFLGQHLINLSKGWPIASQFLGRHRRTAPWRLHQPPPQVIFARLIHFDGDNVPGRQVFEPFVDEQGGDAKADWYIGDFQRQFVWTEIWPVQTFLQRSESSAAFERDVVLRVKARYFGGISAVDTAFVTKVSGTTP